jgi:hypothetical protein
MSGVWDVSHTRMKAMKAVATAATDAGARLFGSFVFREQVLSPSIRAFYRECRENHLTPSTVYDRPGFHAESYHDRQFTPRDIDIFLPKSMTKDALLESIRGCLTFIRVTVAGEADLHVPPHCTTKISANLSKYIIEVPCKTLGSVISFRMDVVSCSTDTLDAGAFPSVMKMLVQDKVGCISLTSDCGEVFGKVSEYFLGALRSMHTTMETVTPFLCGQLLYPAFGGTATEIFNDVRTYYYRLTKELRDNWSFLNLSVQLDLCRRTLVFTRGFHSNGEVYDLWGETEFDLEEALERTPMYDLKRGRFVVPNVDLSETVFVHILCDPDFVVRDHKVLMDLL